MRVANRFEEAANLYRRALQLKPRFPAARYNLAITLAHMGNLRDAVTEAEHALRDGLKGTYRTECQDWVRRLRAALQAQAEGQRAEAERRRKVELATQSFHEGNQMYSQKRFAEAEAAFRKAFGYDPDNATADNIGLALWGQGRLPEAEEFFRKAMALGPTLPNGYGNLGALLLNQGRNAEAENLLQRAVQLGGDAHIQGNLAVCLVRRAAASGANAPDRAARYAEAETLIRKALEAEPNVPIFRETFDHIQTQQKAAVVASSTGSPESQPRASDSIATAVQRAVDQAYSNFGSTSQGLQKTPEEMAAAGAQVIDTVGHPATAPTDPLSLRRMEVERKVQSLAAFVPPPARTDEAVQNSVAWYARLEIQKQEKRKLLAGVQADIDHHQGDSQANAAKKQQLTNELERIEQDQETAQSAARKRVIDLGLTWGEGSGDLAHGGKSQ